MRKRKTAISIFAVIAIVLMVSTVALAGQDETGSGAPSGKHYNLNLIGVKDEHPKNMADCDSVTRIFVNLGTKGVGSQTKIMLTSCEDKGYGSDCAVPDVLQQLR
jgi:hypothetical protein